MRLQSLPGHAVKSPSGVITGYSYYLVDRPVGYIGNLYVRAEFASAQVYQSLLERTLCSLKSWSNVGRIECQVFPFNLELAPLFRQQGFTPLKRHFLSMPVDRLNGSCSPRTKSTGFQILPWKPRFFEPAAAVIYDSYRGSPDYRLCLDYQSLRGCARFLRNLVDNPGCGIFSADTSYVALDGGGQLCGILIASRIEAETGMIPQISVRNSCQGKGLGTILLCTYLREAKKRGFRRITLSVSDANRRAYHLYRRFGFQKTKDFHAFIWGDS